jgi:hypothetical protein
LYVYQAGYEDLSDPRLADEDLSETPAFLCTERMVLNQLLLDRETPKIPSI